jgi:hypothetical protein
MICFAETISFQGQAFQPALRQGRPFPAVFGMLTGYPDRERRMGHNAIKLSGTRFA